MPLNLQAILDAAQDADSPEARANAVKALLAEGGPAPTRDEVTAVLDEAVEKFGALNESEPSDPESLLGLELLADVATVARETQVTIDQTDAENRARREELAAKVAGPSDEGDPTAETDAGAGDGSADRVDAAAVAASAKRRFALANIKTPTTAAPQAKTDNAKPTLSITAAADVRGFAGGQDLDGMDGLVAAAMAKIGAMPVGVDGVHVRAGYAQIRVPYPKELVASASGSNHAEVIEYAASQARLTGGSLAAAGGWCAPSETLYDLAPLLADANAGLVDVPDISVKRGGLKTPAEADFSATWAGNVGIIQTEAQAIAGTDRVLFRVPCTTFAESRLDVIYTGIVAGILQNDAYPELTRQYVEGALAAHAHKVNLSTIARMVNAAGTEVDLSATVGPSAVGSLLNGLELRGRTPRWYSNGSAHHDYDDDGCVRARDADDAGDCGE